MQNVAEIVRNSNMSNSTLGTDKADALDRALTVKSKPLNSSPSGGSSPSSTSGGGSNITADDFMTLLVSELKNQDPTAPTDPNSYIDQLVQVNSLQQLISINQGITSLTGTAPSQGSARESRTTMTTPGSRGTPQ